MRHLPSRLAAVGAAFLLVVSFGAAQEKTTHSRRNPVTEAVRNTKAAVVSVKVPPRTGSGKDMIGSGVIVHSEKSPDDSNKFINVIVTNNHVIGSCKQPKIALHNGQDVIAEVLFAEARWDLAALRILTDEVQTVLTPMQTDDLMVGERVIAIGNPFGYKNTVSTGIISALGREINMNGDLLTGLIQTDASINPGNSGGPLLNINGELIGINCAIDTKGPGIAFAIPANTLTKALRTVLSAQRIANINHGLDCQEKILNETGELQERQRVVVASFKAGEAFKTGDEIIAVGGRAVVNAFDVERSLWNAKPGEIVHVEVEREGKTMVVDLKLGASNGAGMAACVRPTKTQAVAATNTAKIVGAKNER